MGTKCGGDTFNMDMIFFFFFFLFTKDVLQNEFFFRREEGGTEWVPTAKWLHRVEAVNARIEGRPTLFGVRKKVSHLETRNTIETVAYKLRLYSLKKYIASLV